MLSNEQVQAFFHDGFVEDQTRHFVSLIAENSEGARVVTDIGGGCGFFAKRLMDLTGYRVRVVDTDPASIEACRRIGLEATCGDALDPKRKGDEDVVSLNLILHHLVGRSDQITTALQRKAIAVWRPYVRALFVHEYIYESYVPGFSGWLIFQITKNRVLSWLCRGASTVLPSLRANTFGVGVRFRAREDWIRVFRSAGYEVTSSIEGEEEPVSIPRRLLLIKKIRRDSFRLQPVSGE